MPLDLSGPKPLTTTLHYLKRGAEKPTRYVDDPPPGVPAWNGIDPENGSGASIGGVGLVFVLAVGLLALGGVLMLVQRARQPAFFRGETLRHDTAALVVPE